MVHIYRMIVYIDLSWATVININYSRASYEVYLFVCRTSDV